MEREREREREREKGWTWIDIDLYLKCLLSGTLAIMDPDICVPVEDHVPKTNPVVLGFAC